MKTASLILVVGLFGVGCGSRSMVRTEGKGIAQSDTIDVGMALLALLLPTGAAANERYISIDLVGVNAGTLIAQASTLPIKAVLRPGNACELRDNRLVESQTGGPCAFLRMEVISLSNTAATVKVTWQGSRLGISSSTFKLVKRDNKWDIESRIHDWSS